MLCSCENTTKRLIIELGVIGKITRGYKLNTKEAFISIDDSTWYQGLLRKYRGDSRQMMLSKITKLTEETEELVNRAVDCSNKNISERNLHFLNREPKDFLKEFSKYIIQCQGGINNLKITYSQDKTVMSCLDMANLTLDNCVKEIKRLLETETI